MHNEYDALMEAVCEPFRHFITLAQADDLKGKIPEAFKVLKLRPRELRVLELRFGLGGDPAYSLRQTAHFLEIGKERVRQLTNRGIEKIRNHFGLKRPEPEKITPPAILR